MFRHLLYGMFGYRSESDDAGGAGAGNPEVTQESTITTDTPEPGKEVPDNKDNPAGTEVDDPDPKPSTKEQKTEGQEEQEEPSIFHYGGQEVGIDIPDDLRTELSDKGLDVDKLATELYREDGDFKFTDETRAALDKAYGKYMVDAFLENIKLKNDGFLKGQADAAVAAEQANVQRFTELMEPFGGEEGWDKLSKWGEENLSNEELDDLNAVMTSGNPGLQRYAIQMLVNRQRLAEGDPEAVLISGAAKAASEGGPLTAEQYAEADAALRKEYRGNPAG